ncbi:MAG: hypothetical protein Q8P34_09680 [Bacteroidota bacterium]|nr:hypothetical protein [Bacteroidota bacterium]
MDAKIIFWLVFTALTALVLYLNVKHGILLDESTRKTKKPYSYSRTQLTWWTVIILSGFVTVILKYQEIPTLTEGILILLGISAATSMAARITDNSDQDQTNTKNLIQNLPGDNFLIDILSDSSGVSIHRLQAVLFNLVIGFWFIQKTLANIADPTLNMANILPDIETNNLILMGLSAGTYAALKTTENKGVTEKDTATKDSKKDEDNEIDSEIDNEIPPVG